MSKITNSKIAVVGIGRVGLPLALAFANEGFTVYGVDINTSLVELLLKKQMPFLEVDGKKLLRKLIGKKFFPTTNYSVISEVDYIIMCLGTGVDQNLNPVYKEIDTALNQAANYFRKNQTLILRSTVSPATTEYIKSFINKIRRLEVGKNFYVAFCPERIVEGKALKELSELPQVIGATDKETVQKCIQLFSAFGVECLVTDEVSAELAKIFTNMYRYINFAIANEFMMIAQNYGKDILEIVNLVNKGYKRGGLALPGLSAGPCLYKDGFFITDSLPFIDLIHTSWKINQSTPVYLINKLKELTSLRSKKVVILGLSFKADIDDPRESLALTAKNAFSREGARTIIHDPLIRPYDTDVYLALQNADIIFVATRHKEYSEINHKKVKQVCAKDSLVCDIWNVFGKGKIIFKTQDLPN